MGSIIKMAILHFHVILLFVLIFKGQVSSQICRQNASKLIGNSCYQYFSSETTWDVAQRQCELKGLKLAYLRSRDPAFSGILWNLDLNKNAWIGANDKKSEGDFIWADSNEKATELRSLWREGEPNNTPYNNGTYDEDCVGIYFTFHANDVPCTRFYPYLCMEHSCPYDFKFKHFLNGTVTLSWMFEFTSFPSQNFSVSYQEAGVKAARVSFNLTMLKSETKIPNFIEFSIRGLSTKTSYNVYLDAGTNNGRTQCTTLVLNTETKDVQENFPLSWWVIVMLCTFPLVAVGIAILVRYKMKANKDFITARPNKKDPFGKTQDETETYNITTDEQGGDQVSDEYQSIDELKEFQNTHQDEGTHYNVVDDETTTNTQLNQSFIPFTNVPHLPPRPTKLYDQELERTPKENLAITLNNIETNTSKVTLKAINPNKNDVIKGVCCADEFIVSLANIGEKRCKLETASQEIQERNKFDMKIDESESFKRIFDLNKSQKVELEQRFGLSIFPDVHDKKHLQCFSKMDTNAIRIRHDNAIKFDTTAYSTAGETYIDHQYLMLSKVNNANSQFDQNTRESSGTSVIFNEIKRPLVIAINADEYITPKETSYYNVTENKNLDPNIKLDDYISPTYPVIYAYSRHNELDFTSEAIDYIAPTYVNGRHYECDASIETNEYITPKEPDLYSSYLYFSSDCGIKNDCKNQSKVFFSDQNDKISAEENYIHFDGCANFKEVN